MSFIFNSPRFAGNCYTTYDGTNETTDIDTSTSTFNYIQNTDAYGISIWFKLPDHTVNDIVRIMGSNALATASKGFWIDYENRSSFSSPKRVRISTTYGTPGLIGTRMRTNSNAITSNDWHHLLFTSNATTGKIFVNGVDFGLDVNLHTTLSTGASTYDTQFASAGNANDVSNIHLDKAIFYTDYISASEASDIYNYGRKPGLIGIGSEFAQYEFGALSPTDKIGSNDTTSNNQDASNIICE